MWNYGFEEVMGFHFLEAPSWDPDLSPSLENVLAISLATGEIISLGRMKDILDCH
jgi:hypothetical protein